MLLCRYILTSFFIIAACLLISCFSSYAQRGKVTEIDSLKRQLEYPMQDSIRTEVYLRLAAVLGGNDPDSALVYANKSMQLCEQYGYEDKKARTLITTGAIYQMLANYTTALSYYFKGLRLGESLKMPNIQSKGLNNIGVCYSSLNHYKLAEKYLKASLAVKLRYRMNRELSLAYVNLSDVAGKQGRIYEVIAYCKQAIEADKKYGTEISLAHVNLGDAYLALNKLAQAKYHYNYAWKLELKNNDADELINCYLGLGKTATLENDFKNAASHLFKAKEIAAQSGVGIANADINDAIANMYQREKRFDLAYAYKEKAHAIRDSTLNETITKQITEMQAKYESDKKDQEIKLLNKDKELTETRSRTSRNFMISLLVFVVVISLVIARNIVLKQKVKNRILSEEKALVDKNNVKLLHENTESRYEVLKSKTNPHFLFNSLSTLSSIVMRDQNLARLYIKNFAELYRTILQTGDEKTIPLAKELDIAGNYLYLEQMRFKDALVVEQKIMVDTNAWHIPPFAIQMAIENAIKHNVLSQNRKLTITILATAEHVVITNNIQKKRSAPPSTSTGQKNTTERYRLLSSVLPAYVETPEAYIVTLPILPKTKFTAQDHITQEEEPDHTWTVS